MNHNSDSNIVPRAPRFKVADSSEVTVTITRTEESDDQSLPAGLVDVSQHGVKLRVPVNLRFEEALQLKIDVLGTELEYLGVASVRHIRALNDEYWLVGCAIAPPLSDETFAHLATSAGKERRRFRRIPISAEATVRRQAQTEGTAATIHNLSSGGICFSSDVLYEIGESVQLTIDGTDGEPRVIEARICWQVESPEGSPDGSPGGSPGGSIVGCQFSSSVSYAELCACLIEQPSKVLNRSSAEPTSKLVLTAAILAMFVPPMMTLLMQANKVSAKANMTPTVVETLETLDEEVVVLSEVPEQAEVEDNGQTSRQIREWIDNTGKHRTQAFLVEVTSEYVVLQKSNGRQSNVPLRRLSAADCDYAKDWQARQQ